MADTVTKNGSTKRSTALGGDTPTNGGEEVIAACIPYIAEVTIQGVADLLFHRWNCEAVAEKASAAKGSKAKKTDNIESYVYRDDAGQLCLPGEYLRGAIVAAAKFRQDPRSPRKSAMDLFKAAVVPLTVLAPVYMPGKTTEGQGEERLGEASRGQARLGMVPVSDWSYEHACRVVIQRNAVTRVRPAMKAGWEATIQFMISLPEYISAALLHGVLNDAGRLVGVGDFRPTYGRFLVTKFGIQD